MKSNKIGILLMLLSLLIIGLNHQQAEAAEPVSVTIDGGQAVDNRILVPLRDIFEEMDAYVEWTRENNMIRAVKGDTAIILFVNSRHTYVNGTHQLIDVPARAILGRTFVPLRFVGESFGAEVHWDSVNYRGMIQMPDKEIIVTIPKPDRKWTKSEVREFLEDVSEKLAFEEGRMGSNPANIDTLLATYLTTSLEQTFLRQFIYEYQHDYYFNNKAEYPLYAKSVDFFSWDHRTKIEYSQNQTNRIITISENVPSGVYAGEKYQAFNYQVQLVENLYSSDGYKIHSVKY